MSIFRTLKVASPLAIFILLSFLFWKGLHTDPHKLPSPLIGKPLPAFKLPALMDEGKWLEANDLKGHIALINVFATWCITCHEEHPILMDIAASHKVLVYGIDYKDDPVKAREWLTQYGNPYEQVVVDQQGSLAIDLGVYGTPETFLIDEKGVIRYKHIGAVSPSVWRRVLEPEVRKLQKEKENQHE